MKPSPSPTTPPHSLIEARYLIPLLLCTKLLLIPAYRSTDFDVHRNWLAITHHLPLSEWYFTDGNGTTVHTLDYPPSFAWFECFLSTNPLTRYLIASSNDILDSRCLAVLPDDDNDVGYDCVVFQRCTVIFLGDVMFWIGCWCLCRAMDYDDTNDDDRPSSKKSKPSEKKTPSRLTRGAVVFALAVCNPGLILLDHIHFQYNGMLLGMLLSSLAALVHAIPPSRTPSTQRGRREAGVADDDSTNGMMNVWDIVGAVLFAVLLTFKHLYITLAPLYTVYLFRKVCFIRAVGTTGDVATAATRVFSLRRLLFLGITLLTVLLLPLVPFLIPPTGILSPATSTTEYAGTVLKQMLSRLFPFQRGLCHDYWAGNLWALYLGVEKIIGLGLRIAHRLYDTTGHSTTTIATVTESIERYMYPFPTVTPLTTALLLLLTLTPPLFHAWSAASSSSPTTTTTTKTTPSPGTIQKHQRETLLYTIVFSSLSAFFVSYHVHEKAIMTAVLPMTYLAVTSRDGARLYLRLSALGHFGLLPLLFRPNELLLKIVGNVAFFVGSVLGLECVTGDGGGGGGGGDGSLLTRWDWVGLGGMVMILLFSEVVHPLMFGGVERMEFLPLMLISLFCAVGLGGCWVDCRRLMVRSARGCVVH